MAQKKASEVEAFLSRPDFSFPLVLLYGPDPGLVSERSDRLAAASGVDRDDPFASVTLAADELEKDIGRLYDEARTVSMFGGRRLIRVRGAGAGKSLAEAAADLGAEKLQDATVIIEAGDLKGGAGLRLNIERAKFAIALPCYQDEGRALDQIIDEELKAAGLSMDKEAREELRSRLGANRIASRGEVKKLCLYALGTPTITEEDVRAIVGDVSADTLEETIDAAVSGEVKRLPHLIDRLTSAGTQTFQLHQGLLRYFQQLLAMREAVERKGETVARVIERRRPFFRRRHAMETALAAWPLEEITSALGRIEADILASRKESGLALTITRKTLLDIAVEAARLRARGRRGG
ncbi:DNA polymerase III subunit delta [Aurantimonas sp. VKM B-3413]|uniref:DNA polymerase III subunit delta n=1 Tax=Aurantimonas sp. VKM B-3413 TaxID=2779401 RepID=UPI001E6043F2|nr:DNA polymerase III subunit delta [Aurantimonas sp. VKM B-3413]MCB8840554.1 DNA polymerase III subunit delta [Aurantimonas sp. VKM B-3413]